MLNENERKKAEAIQSRLRDQLADSDTNQDLSQEGRARMRARAVLAAQSELRALRDASNAREQAAYSKAYRAAFGLSLDRAAEDRALRAEFAHSLGNGEVGVEWAQQRMDAALAIGDSMVARALAEVAFERRNDQLDGQAWVRVCETYGSYAPAVDRVLSAVFEAGAIPHAADQFTDKAATEVIVPRDLVGSLETIAAGDEVASGAS